VYSSTSIASSSFPSPVLRKTSHKAAEQKRRDSLKTTFDDLRMLLPPIPLPTEDGYPDEPILPGAMPPRGPPRGNADGPNRGISKLQLLRCGNDYICLLKESISRRDNEISLLRSEVRRLRGFISEDVWREGANEIDLERDVDLGAVGPWRRSTASYDADDMEEDAAE
jgi:Helix-loop-helix DNA-binding domain